MQGILTHEFGHALGLGDIYYSTDVQSGLGAIYTQQTMYYRATAASSFNLRTLEVDNIYGVKQLYQ